MSSFFIYNCWSLSNDNFQWECAERLLPIKFYSVTEGVAWFRLDNKLIIISIENNHTRELCLSSVSREVELIGLVDKSWLQPTHRRGLNDENNIK